MFGCYAPSNNHHYPAQSVQQQSNAMAMELTPINAVVLVMVVNSTINSNSYQTRLELET